jgi:flagellar basal-body rod modification protein FlgD
MSAANPITQSSINAASTTSTTSANNASELKDQFLQLLVVQLKNQDPLDPIKNQDFVAELAQFSSLEQMTTLNSNFSDLLSVQTLSTMTQFIGKDVAWYDSDGNTQTGAVTAVQVDNDGNGYLVVDGALVDFTDVYAIGNGS